MRQYKEDASFWNQIWRRDSYSSPELRILKSKEKVDLLLQMVNITTGWEVLDVGCGGGYISEELYSRINCNITGIDFSKTAINIASFRLSNIPNNPK